MSKLELTYRGYDLKPLNPNFVLCIPKKTQYFLIHYILRIHFKNNWLQLSRIVNSI
jgi:hypothetical protein